MGVALFGVGHQAGVGQNDGIYSQIGCAVDGQLPDCFTPRLRVGVERQQHLAAACMGVLQASDNGGRIKVQPGKVAGIGGIAKAQVHAVGTVIDRRLQRRQAACGANQLGFAPNGLIGR